MIWVVIRGAMERNHIKSFAELARLTGIKQPTLTQTRRRNPNSFLWWERMDHRNNNRNRYIPPLSSQGNSGSGIRGRCGAACQDSRGRGRESINRG